MSRKPVSRRAFLAGLALVPLASASAPSLAAPSLRLREMRVDVSRLRARRGDPTARWVEQELPGRLNRAFRGRIAPGDPNGATLLVRIDDVILASVRRGHRAPRTIDEMTGAAMVSGGGRAPLRRPIRATAV